MMTTTIDCNALTLPDCYAALRAGGAVHRLFVLAYDEDLGPERRDITTEIMGIAGHNLRADLTAREPGVASGLAAIDDLRAVFAPSVSCETHHTDGDRFQPGDVLATLEGPAGELLALERTLLNLLGRLCGIATLTRAYAGKVSGTTAQILDTRKTTPGWRALEKYAVRCGGGHCHRLGLHDAVLIKDNHIALAGATDLSAALCESMQRARSASDIAFVEIEVDTLEQLDRVLKLDEGLIDIVLLDNMPPDMLEQAVARRDAEAPNILLEASGGVTLETISAIAATGVDRISVGALTHQARSIDLGLDAR